MAKNWEIAQQNEKKFWDKIYVKNEVDIKSHRPVKIERGLEFLFKTLNRHGIKLNQLNGRQIADLGCGPTGLALGLNFLTQNLNKRGTKIFAIDPLINHYQKYGMLKSSEQLLFVPTKGENTGLEDKSLDLVFSSNAMDHVDDPATVVREVRRILKPSGKFLVSSHVLYQLYSPFSPIFKYVDKNHPHHFTANSFKKLLEQEFEHVELTYAATMVEDNPDMSFFRILRSANIFRGMKRVFSNYILYTVFFKCE